MNAKIALENYYKMLESLIESGDFSKNSLTSYKVQLSKFHNHFSPATLEEISEITREDFRNFIFALDITNDSKNALLRVVRAYVNYLKNEKLIEDENITGVTFANKKYLKSQRVNSSPLTEDEFLKIVAACKNAKERFMVYFLRYTGLRESSVVEVKFSEIDENGLFHVPAKGGKYVPVKLPQELLGFLDEYAKTRNPEKEYLFYPTQGRGAKNPKLNPKSVYIMIKSILDRADISEERKSKISPHKFRHALVTELYVKNPVAANQAVHHSAMSITNRYNDAPYAVGLDAVSKLKIARL